MSAAGASIGASRRMAGRNCCDRTVGKIGVETNVKFEFEPGVDEFRQEIRNFLKDNLPEDMKLRQMYAGTLFAATKEDELAWVKILGKKGWQVYSWPKELGGCDWSPLKQFVFEDEMVSGFAPPLPFNLLHMIGPVIYRFGSPQLQERFLPKMRSGDEITWAQGFSEPGAGSDLASLSTRAERVGDKYVINGSKIWTSGAHEATWGFFLVKTDTSVKPQEGISMILVDMNTPGISVRTIPQINSDEQHLCQVFLDNVEVPAENLIGEPNKGWTYAKKLLEGERTGSSYIFWNKREMRRLVNIAKAEELRGNPIAKDRAWRARLARLQAELTALEWSVLRVLAKEEFPKGIAPAASALKVRGSELQHAITECQIDLLGEKAMRLYPTYSLPEKAGALWPEHVLGRTGTGLIIRAATVFGGSKQVQRNIIAKAAFGL